MTIPPDFDGDWFNPKPGTFGSIEEWHHQLMSFADSRGWDVDDPEVREACFWLLLDGESATCAAAMPHGINLMEVQRIDRDIRNGVWVDDIPSWYGLWNDKFPVPEWYQQLVYENYR